MFELAADVIYTYFQDEFGTTHYIICIGDNSSGKNAILMTFASLGYRVLLATSVSAANVYTFLGSLEECQGTIAEDEINNLDNDPVYTKVVIVVALVEYRRQS